MRGISRLRAPTSAALAVVALGLLAAPAPADPALSEPRYRALDALYTAQLPFDRERVSRSAIDGAQRACERLDPADALLGAVRRACSATLAFARRAEVLSQCSTPEGCLEASMTARAAIPRVLSTARTANRAIATTVPSLPCRRALRTPADELRLLERLVTALRLLERAIQTDSPADLEEANRRIAAFDRAARSGPSARGVPRALPSRLPVSGFDWRDGERTIRFGPGAAADAGALLGDGYALLTTPRAREMVPELAERAASVHDVRPGLVDEIAGELLGEVDGDLVVALGGGRVIDTAKALASAVPGRRAAAVPTTLSAAEMTAIHRRARGADASLPAIRPAVVLNDPALSASQPPAELAASAANALGHAAEGPATIHASPVPALAGREAARLIGAAYAGRAQPDRDALALGALLSGYAIDSAGYGLHHVLSQTLVRVGGAGHGPANAAMLPHTLGALERRGARGAAALVELARDLARRAGAERLRDIGIAEEAVDACADAAVQRPELDHTPPRADRDEIRALYAAAW